MPGKADRPAAQAARRAEPCLTTKESRFAVLDLGSHGPGRPAAPGDAWWRSAAIYQLYVRSFADGNGDGIGDLAGVRAHLPYLAELGVDAIWFNPWYKSPMSDAGYDISDYRDIEPIFGGPAWTRITEPDGSPGEWYLHLFAPEQPDFNWANASVRQEFEDVLRFWFERGADGVRIDSAGLLTKDPDLRDVGPDELPGPDHPYSDRDDVHAIYRSWRSVADESPARGLVGGIWVPDAERLARYVGPGELHTVFNFPYLSCPWDAVRLREVIDSTLALNAPVGAPATWVLSNHDVDRIVSRYGRADTAFSLQQRPYFHSFA